MRSSQTKRSPEVPEVYGRYRNWSKIYLGVMSGAVRMTSCKNVLDGGRGFESTCIVCAVLQGCRGFRIVEKELNVLKAIKKACQGIAICVSLLELQTEGRFPICFPVCTTTGSVYRAGSL